MGKIIFIIILISNILSGFFIINICEAKPVAERKVIELKFSTGFPADQIVQSKMFEPWGKKMRELSKGRIVLKFYPNGQLGKSSEQYDLVTKGIADMTYTLHNYYPGRFNIIPVFELPFIIPNAEKASVAMWTLYEKFPECRNEYKGVKVLALFCHPPGHFCTIKKSITQVSDFKGLKFRTANTFVTSALKIFGATPVSMPANETRKALLNGVVDGATFPWEGIVGFKVDDVVKHVALADFYTATMMVVMNQDKFNSLPEDLKELINQHSGLSLSKECGILFDNTNGPFRDQALKQGIIESELQYKDRRKLEAFTIPLRIRWVKEMEAKDLPGKEILMTALDLLGKK